MRALKIVLAVVAVLILVPMVAVFVIVGTETGTRFAADRAQTFLPEGIRYGQVDGRLADRLIVHDIEVENEGMHLTLARAELHWSPSTLMRRQVVIHDLQATTLRLSLLPTEEDPEPAEPFELPEDLDLPVSMLLERATITDIVINPAPDAEPVQIDRVELAGTLADSHLELSHLDIDAPMLTVQGQLSATAAGAYPVSGQFEWMLRLPDYAQMPGTTQLDGTLDALQVEQRLGAPYNTALSATVANLIGVEDLYITADAQVRQLNPADIEAELPAMSVTFGGRIVGPVDALQIDADVQIADVEQGTTDASISALLRPDAVQIHELVITQPTHDGRLEGAGRIAFDEGVAADMRVVWQRLQWPLDDVPTVRSPRGELHVTGPPENYQLSVAAVVEIPEQPTVTLELDGAGDLESIAFDLRAMTDVGRLSGHADLRWEPELVASVDVRGEDIDPEGFAPDWPGRINFALTADGEMRDEMIQVRMHRLDASGEIHEAPLALEARADYVQRNANGAPGAAGVPEHSVDIEMLQLSWGSARVALSGQLAESADLQWQVSAPDLAELLPTAHGRIEGAGTIVGMLPLPHVTAEISGAGLSYEDYALEQLEIDADVDLGETNASTLLINARDGAVAGIILEQLQLRGSGSTEAHQFSLRLRSSHGEADAELDGRLDGALDENPTWHFQLTDARLSYPDLAPWQLADTADGRVGIGTDLISVSHHCWASGDARLCLDGEQTAIDRELTFELTGLGYDYFAALMPPGFDLRGELSASGALAQRGDAVPTGEVELATTAGEFLLTDQLETSPATSRFRLEPSHARVSLLPEALIAEVALNMEHGHLRLDARLPDPAGDTPIPERTLEGALSVDVPDLAFVADMVPDLTDMEGRITGELELAGTLQDPELTGRAQLQEGLARLPVAGITLTDIDVVVRGLGADGIALTASAVSGEGSINASGEMSLPGGEPRANLRIEGENFQLANTREARIFVNPDLTIEAGAERIDVVGEVFIPRADITPAARPPAAVTASPDQVLVEEGYDEDELVRDPARQFHARVRVRLGNAVRFEGFGLTARFEGNVLAVEAPDVPTTGTGELRILDGEYRAYGQGLVIETGHIYFAGGPITEPALDIRAVRRPQEGILVGAHVVGTLEEPEFTLFSEPPMTQQEQLSYLVLGRSLQEAPTGERSALAQAALAMGLRGGDFLARNIGERIGVDQLTIETGTGEAGAATDVDQAALVAGKYLSPRLYVSYGIGLFDPVNVLRIQYTISENWRLITESSSESTGADIVYTIERGE